MKVVYMAHPYGGRAENLRRARRWVRWIEQHYGVAVVANWIIECEIWDDASPAERKAGLARDIAVIERCDEIWAVGGAISSGMTVEIHAAGSVGVPLMKLTHLGDEPPAEKVPLPRLVMPKTKTKRRTRVRSKRCRRP